MNALRGAAFKIEGPPENGSAAPTANRDGTDHRRNKKPLGSASIPDRYEPRSVPSTGKQPGPTKKRQKQAVDDRFAGETPKQIALHREIDRHYAGHFAWDDRDDPGRRRPTGKQNFRMRDLEATFRHRYRGRLLTDDDSGRDDLLIAAHHCYHFGGDPGRRIRAWAQQWAPWASADELSELIDRVCKRPLKWKADTLGKKLRLTREERAGLGITTIGAFDDSKHKRAKRRGKRKNDRRQSRRHAAGAAAQALSTERAAPWDGEGISRRTWYRRRKEAKSATVTEAPASANLALNGTTLAPTKYSSNCWGPPAKVQVFRPAVEDGLEIGGIVSDGRVAHSAPPAAKTTVKINEDRSCFHRENGEQK